MGIISRGIKETTCKVTQICNTCKKVTKRINKCRKNKWMMAKVWINNKMKNNLLLRKYKKLQRRQQHLKKLPSQKSLQHKPMTQSQLLKRWQLHLQRQRDKNDNDQYVLCHYDNIGN